MPRRGPEAGFHHKQSDFHSSGEKSDQIMKISSMLIQGIKAKNPATIPFFPASGIPRVPKLLQLPQRLPGQPVLGVSQAMVCLRGETLFLRLQNLPVHIVSDQEGNLRHRPYNFLVSSLPESPRYPRYMTSCHRSTAPVPW